MERDGKRFPELRYAPFSRERVFRPEVTTQPDLLQTSEVFDKSFVRIYRIGREYCRARNL